MTFGSRRIFWGHSLAQAVSRASRYYAVPADRLAYRVHEKRHGFVKHPRNVLIEVDPRSPRLADDAAPAPRTAPTARATAAPAPAEPPASAATAAPAPRPAREATREPARVPAREPARESAREPAREPEHWDTPDEESLYAAVEAARALVRLAGLELTPVARVVEDRLEIELAGTDEERLRELGFELLGDLEHLLPRAVQTLSGRHVRCRLEAAGLRAAHEEKLRARAREAAERVLASGLEELLEPLNPAERRIVHLALAGRADVATESVGSGFLKRVKIEPSGRHD